MKLKIIITMAGEGNRFKKVGLEKPKYMLIAKDSTIFEWSMKSLENFFDYEFIFVSRKGHKSKKFIKDKCNILGISDFEIKELDYLTEGQADTVLTIGDKIKGDDSIIVYNIDTFIEPDQLNPNQIRGDGWVPCFRAEGTHWSFVEFDENQKVNKIKEKVRISDFATIGLYYFSSFNLFEESYIRHNFKKNLEKYIAPIYSVLIENNSKDVYTHLVESNSVHVMGTPKEALEFDPQFLSRNR